MRTQVFSVHDETFQAISSTSAFESLPLLEPNGANGIQADSSLIRNREGSELATVSETEP